MAWKLDDKGFIAMQGEHPIWLGDDGAEIAFDAKANIVAAATAKREAGESRKAKKEAEDKLAAFAGIEDPAAAIKALQFAQSMDGKKVMDDEGIQKMIQASLKPLQEENAAMKAAREQDTATIYKMKVSDKFNTSEFIKQKTIFGETPDIAEAYFSKNIRVEDGKTVIYDYNGSPVYSSVKAGEVADFEEGMAFLVNNHPRKDHMLKATGGGSGAQQSQSQGSNGKKQMSRANVDALDPAAKMEFFKSGGTLTPE